MDAAADGTAQVTLTLDGPYNEFVPVTSHSANGWTSDQVWWNSDYPDSTPTVTSAEYPENASGGGAGVQGGFAFDANVPDVASYTYTVDYGDPFTVAAEADGTARVDWTPADSGPAEMDVFATTRSGAATATRYYGFTVN